MTQRGTASLELALGMSLLVIPAVVAVLSFSPWLEARSFVRSAAAEGARAAVLASGDPTSAGTSLVAAMAEGREYEGVAVEMCGGALCVLERGAYVTVRVSLEVPLVSTPWGDVGGVVVEGFHAEPVDAYRSLP